MKVKNKLKKVLSVFASLLIVLGFCSTLAATASADSLSQGYQTSDSNLVVGMAASLSNTSNPSQTFIERATADNSSKYVGIVTTINASLVTLTNKTATAFVITLGNASALASDLNGQIKKGDNLTLSPLKGVIMKADSDEPKIIGSALEDFSTANSHSETVTTTKGTSKAVKIGLLKIALDAHGLAGVSTVKKPYLVLFGQSLTGRTVNQWQVIAALLIFFLLLTVEGAIIYGAVHSAIIAMGRNPLAKKQVYNQLFQVLWLVLIVLVFGGGSIYAVLWA